MPNHQIIKFQPRTREKFTFTAILDGRQCYFAVSDNLGLMWLEVQDGARQLLLSCPVVASPDWMSIPLGIFTESVLIFRASGQYFEIDPDYTGISPPSFPRMTNNNPTMSVTATQQINEGNANHYIDITVSLSEPPTYHCWAHYATSNGTATAGSDYIATSGQIDFYGGETSKAIAVQIIGDTIWENDKAFNLTLSAPAKCTLDNATQVVTILNDDAGYEILTFLSSTTWTSTFTGTVEIYAVGGGGGSYDIPWSPPRSTASFGSYAKDYADLTGGQQGIYNINRPQTNVYPTTFNSEPEAYTQAAIECNGPNIKVVEQYEGLIVVTDATSLSGSAVHYYYNNATGAQHYTGKSGVSIATTLDVQVGDAVVLVVGAGGLHQGGAGGSTTVYGVHGQSDIVVGGGDGAPVDHSLTDSPAQNQYFSEYGNKGSQGAGQQGAIRIKIYHTYP